MSAKKKLPYKFILFSAAVLIAIFVLEKINHRFWLNDFKVYYGGAQSLMNNKQVYGIAYGLDSGLYKYSPFIALLVAPLTLFSFETAAVIQFFLVAISIIVSCIVSLKIIRTYLFSDKIKNQEFLLSVGFVCVINHLFRELHLGNVNVILLMLMCFSLLSILQSRYIVVGILLALVVMTKPFFLLLLMPLVLRKKVKTILSFCVSMLVLVALPAFVTGFQKDFTLHKDWLHTMLEHNSTFPSNNTIESLIKLYIHPGLPTSFQFYVMIAACVGYIIFFFAGSRLERKNVNEGKASAVQGLIVEWFLLIAITPLLFKTDTQHFLLSLPLVLILLCYLSSEKKYFLTACFVLLIFFYGGNSSDLVGKTFSSRLDDLGILGISNLMMIGWVIFIYFKTIRRSIQVS